MCRMNRAPRMLNRSRRLALAILSLCLLVSAVPCADSGADLCCDDCGQDDLIASSAASYAPGSSLLVKQCGCLLLPSPELFASRVPHPPTN